MEFRKFRSQFQRLPTCISATTYKCVCATMLLVEVDKHGSHLGVWSDDFTNTLQCGDHLCGAGRGLFSTIDVTFAIATVALTIVTVTLTIIVQ